MLEIRHLEKSFGNKQVLFGVDLTAQQGHILGLVGKNGAGKTTIFHSILRFLDYSGEIRLDGKAITQETYKEIGYLPEERSLMPKLTIFEQVRYLAALKRNEHCRGQGKITDLDGKTPSKREID